MMKFICFLLALVAVSNAVNRKATFTSGHIIQGTNATNVIVKQNGVNYEIKWQEKFDSKNSVNVHFAHFYEDTGRWEITKLDNLCDSYQAGTLEFAIKYFVLTKLANSNTCPIRKGVQKVNFPVTKTYRSNTNYCGPVLTLIHIFRNNETNPDVTPLLISARFRGTITGRNCKK